MNFKFLSAALFVFIFFPPWQVKSQNLKENQTPEIKAGSSVSAQIGGGEIQNHNINSAANQFLFVTVKQQATDVTVKLISPDGKIAAAVDSTLGGSVFERLWVITNMAGVYRLEIASLEKPNHQGKYEVKLAESRPADEKAEKIVAAAKISAEGFQLQEQRTAAGYAAAIEKYKEAAKLAQSAGDLNAELMPRVWQGVFYAFINQPQLALENNDAARKIALELNDRATEAQILDNYGRIYYVASEPVKALDYLIQALNLRNEIGARIETTTSLQFIALINSRIGNYEKAIEYSNRALEIYREAGNEFGEAQALANLGGTYVYLGEHQKSIEFNLKALAYFRKTKITNSEVTVLNNIGVSYDVLGEPQKAIEFYNESLAVARATGNRQVETRTLINIGIIYTKLGDPDAANDSFTSSLPIARELKSYPEIVSNLNGLGTLAISANNPTKALAYLTEGNQTAIQAKDKPGEFNTLYNIGWANFQLGKYPEALKNYQDTLEIARGLNNPLLQVNALNGIGKTLSALGEQEKANNTLSEAVATIRKTDAPRLEAETLYYLAQFQNRTGKLEEAQENIESSIKLLESIRSRVAGQELRSLYLAGVADIYALRIEILMNLQKARPGESFDARAFQAAENARARSLLDLLNESRTDIRQGVSAELLGQERSTRQMLSAKANLQAQIFASKTSTAEQKAGVQAEVKKLTEDYEKIQAEIRLASPRYAALTQPAPLSVKEIQKQILDRDTVLLEYSMGENHSYLWVVGQNSLNAFELPARGKIESVARNVYDSLTFRNRLQTADSADKNQGLISQAEIAFSQSAAELSRMILLPAAAQIAGKRLLIVADGGLQYVPFGVLTSGKNSALLALSNEIVTLPSASTLAVLRREKKASANFSSLAVIADPVFNRDDSRLNTALKTDNASQTGLTSKIVKRSAEESGLVTFSRLRFSREEADNIARIGANLKPLKVVDFEANKSTVLSGKLNESNIVHFATHGLINSQNPELSGVVLSLVNQNGEAEDGFLRLFEIYNLQLKADLVVLSACQTALGKDIKGEGLIGLTRGFMYAGTPRVVASLWNVDDRATAELMKRFYQKLLRDKMRPAAALRAAQIEMRNNQRFKDPYFWAAFTLQGEWR